MNISIHKQLNLTGVEQLQLQATQLAVIAAHAAYPGINDPPKLLFSLLFRLNHPRVSLLAVSLQVKNAPLVSTLYIVSQPCTVVSTKHGDFESKTSAD